MKVILSSDEVDGILVEALISKLGFDPKVLGVDRLEYEVDARANPPRCRVTAILSENTGE